MKIHFTCILFVTLALLSGSIATGQNNNISKPARRVSLPDNPCEVLNAAQLSAITGLEVTSVQRVPSISKVVKAERENREPGPGTICRYETRSDFGEITIYVPTGADRRSAVYWKNRAKYFEAYPRSGQSVAGLGMDAWIAGGGDLHVLVREDEYFTVSTQMYQPGSQDLLVKIARVVLDQL